MFSISVLSRLVSVTLGWTVTRPGQTVTYAKQDFRDPPTRITWNLLFLADLQPYSQDQATSCGQSLLLQLSTRQVCFAQRLGAQRTTHEATAARSWPPPLFFLRNRSLLGSLR